MTSRRQGEPTKFASWAPWAMDGLLLPLTMRDAIAPGYARATFEFNLPLARADVWDWHNYLALDDLAAIVSSEPAPGDRSCPFLGFLTDADWRFDENERLILTACGPAFRLHRDVRVYGRAMVSLSGLLRHYSAMPCVFNAGGRPNRTKSRVTLPTPLGSDGRMTEMYLFTHDRDKQAEFWTPSDIFDYLQFVWNPQETWIVNCDFDPAARDDSVAPEVAVEGLSLWEALAAAGDKCGYDVIEWIANDGTGNPVSRIRLVKRGQGNRVILRHQPVGQDGNFQTLSVPETNLFSASIAESVASSVTCPIVAGGAALVEIAVPLYPAWDPALLAEFEGAAAQPGHEDVYPEPDYVKRYCTGGTDFVKYRAVGRLWDANTDGRYSQAPYNAPEVPDMGGFAGQAGLWPAMPYRPLSPLAMLSQVVKDCSMAPIVQWKPLDAETWYDLAGCVRIFPDRLGAYISVDNLASILPILKTDPVYNPPPNLRSTNVFMDNFFAMLKGVGIQMRMTCVVESPARNMLIPKRRATAGTAFATTDWFDREQLGQVRLQMPSSSLAGQGDPDVTLESEAIAQAAGRIQDANEDRSIEASITLEWPDPTVNLTDCIERIAGIAVDLGTNSGPARRFPRVVGRAFDFTPEGYNTALQLDTFRKAGLI